MEIKACYLDIFGPLTSLNYHVLFFGFVKGAKLNREFWPANFLDATSDAGGAARKPPPHTLHGA